MGTVSCSENLARIHSLGAFQDHLRFHVLVCEEIESISRH